MIEGPPATIINQEITSGGTHLRTRMKGELPGVGYPYEGWTGPETVVEQARALRTFEVRDRKETLHETFERVVGKAVYNVLLMTGIGDDTNQLYLEAAHGMSVLRDEWDRHFTGSLELIVHDRIQRLDYEREVRAMGEPAPAKVI